MFKDGSVQEVEFGAGDKPGTINSSEVGPRRSGLNLYYEFHDENTLTLKIGESTLKAVRTPVSELKSGPLRELISKFMSKLDTPPRH